jgi:hypothetical protein
VKQPRAQKYLADNTLTNYTNDIAYPSKFSSFVYSIIAGIMTKLEITLISYFLLDFNLITNQETEELLRICSFTNFIMKFLIS